MALYKVTKAEDAFQYFPPGHFDVRCTGKRQRIMNGPHCTWASLPQAIENL